MIFYKKKNSVTRIVPMYNNPMNDNAILRHLIQQQQKKYRVDKY